MRSKCLAAIIALALTGQVCPATDVPQSPEPTTTNLTVAVSRAEQMEALKKEVDAAEAAYMKPVIKDENSAQTDKAWNDYQQIYATNFPKIFELARQEPTSEVSFKMFSWIVTNRFNQTPQTLEKGGMQSMEFLRDHFATNQSIARICRIVGRRWNPTCQPAIDFLQLAADKNPDREVRGQATFALALLLKNKADALAYWEANPPAGPVWFEKRRAIYLAESKKADSKMVFASAQKLFHIVLEKYADCPSLDSTNTWQIKTTLGDAAQGNLFELEHLAIGKIAPEITGEDIHGNVLKLSDYRGKIVVLSFWASWCGPCMQMVPFEVKLTERLKGKPFALIGVNGDANRDDAKHAVKKENMTWPSFWSKKGADGPIPTMWNVSGWPMVFVLDSDGAIQLKFEGYGGTNTENILNKKVDLLLNQLANRTHS